MDKSYFGGRCRSRHDRGASGEVVVFGILKRNGRVYIVAVDNAKSDALPVIKQKIMPDSIVYMDSLSSYDKPGVSGFSITTSTIPKRLQTIRTTSTALRILESGKTRLAKIQQNRSQIFPAVLERMRIRFNFGTPSRQLQTQWNWCGI